MMSYITTIGGNIEVRIMNTEKAALLESIYLFDEYSANFPRMFCIPEEVGTKGPDYILFSANINYCNVLKFVETFVNFVETISEHVELYNATLFHQTHEAPQMGIKWDRNLHHRILNNDVLERWNLEIRGLL